MADAINKGSSSLRSDAPGARFKSHSGLKVGETKPMLVRKVSSGVCEYAPANDLVEALTKWHQSMAEGYASQAHWAAPGTDINWCRAKAEAHEDAADYLQSQINGADNSPRHMDAGCNGPMALVRELRRVTPDRCMDAAVYVPELCQGAARLLEALSRDLELAHNSIAILREALSEMHAVRDTAERLIENFWRGQVLAGWLSDEQADAIKALGDALATASERSEATTNKAGA